MRNLFIVCKRRSCSRGLFLTLSKLKAQIRQFGTHLEILLGSYPSPSFKYNKRFIHILPWLKELLFPKSEVRLFRLGIWYSSSPSGSILGASMAVAPCVCVPICFQSGNQGYRNGQWGESRRPEEKSISDPEWKILRRTFWL